MKNQKESPPFRRIQFKRRRIPAIPTIQGSDAQRSTGGDFHFGAKDGQSRSSGVECAAEARGQQKERCGAEAS
ncbi:hypothetical protein E1A91_A02G108000v1 [Gossypium mustelinum]|uniref:Uncharacterized protein n=1 Tax=Gossypium mustelinum TaxID=34275 RepID=A0A5D3A5W8_GOSMU|nr:hypothetical protein E1A91_A02G108000v1 [Gossypium mustelinum]